MESVLKSDYTSFNVIIVDNNSSDDSIKRIKSWAEGGEQDILTHFSDLVFPLIDKPIQIYELNINKDTNLPVCIKEQVPSSILLKAIVLLINYENSGFALGNNLGIKISRILFNSKYYFILNNDTVIEKDCISKLVVELETHQDVGAATSAIYHYLNREKIANVGGKITFFAARKYFVKSSREKTKRITFTTGCALLVKHNIFEKTGLFSNKFFFGEEDFEFSWRLRKNNIPLVCVMSSKVYHKIGTSSVKLLKDVLHNKFHYVFNRIIDMKMQFSIPLWRLWRFFLLIYIFIWLILKYKVKLFTACKFVTKLHRYTDKYNDAQKVTVETISEELVL